MPDLVDVSRAIGSCFTWDDGGGGGGKKIAQGRGLLKVGGKYVSAKRGT